VRADGNAAASGDGADAGDRELEHDPEKWMPVFGKDHAQIKEPKRDDDSKKRHHALKESA
jgi:hypothetical protein